MGFAQGSLKCAVDITVLLHCMKVDEFFHTVYMLAVKNLFDSSSIYELYLISIKHHLEEKWYYADGVVLSSDGTQATRFLVDEPVYNRDPGSLEEMSRVVQRIVPEMLRRSGIPSIQPLLCLSKYTW